MQKIYLYSAVAFLILAGAGCGAISPGGWGSNVVQEVKNFKIGSKIIEATLNSEVKIFEKEKIKYTDAPIEVELTKYVVPSKPASCPPNDFCEDWRVVEVELAVNGKTMSLRNIRNSIKIDDDYSMVVGWSPSGTQSVVILAYKKGDCDAIKDERKRVPCIKEKADFMACSRLQDQYAKNICMNGLMDDVIAIGAAKIDFNEFCSGYFGVPQSCLDHINMTLAKTRGQEYCEKIVDPRNAGIKDECYLRSGADCSLIKSDYWKLQCSRRVNKGN